LISGLKINIGKSKLFGVGVGGEETQGWANNLGCGSGILPCQDRLETITKNYQGSRGITP